ncbi:MAG: hypothetical protein R2751_05715 [Bacteroidales bacterium]
MDHIVYLDHKAKELENLHTGMKTMLLRGAMGRKLPHGRVAAGDVLYFIENKGDGLIKAKGVVDTVLHSDKLSREESLALVEEHQERLKLSPSLYQRFAGKRYLVIIALRDIEDLVPFSIDRSAYGNMDDWLPVGNIGKVRLGSGLS